MKTNESHSSIKRLASNMFRRKVNDQSGYVLLLGAGASISSGCPSWQQLCEKYCQDNSIFVQNNDAIATVKNFVRTKAINPVDLYISFAAYLKGHKPSIGYKHLSNLVAQGYFSTILTTNYDCLLETSLINQMDFEDIKIWVRGELSDNKIARSLKFDIPKVNIIKMHGDLATGIFFITDHDNTKIESSLKEMLGGLLLKGLVVVGSNMQDNDILRTLLDSECESVVYINPINPQEHNSVTQSNLNMLTDKQIDYITGDMGDFDTFFTKLDIEIQKNNVSSETKKKERKRIETDIINKQEKGTGYINYSSLTELVHGYVYKINRFNPDCLVFINDPSAPGGMELKRRLMEHFKNKPISTILIEGDFNTRNLNRRVKSQKEDLNIAETDEKILVLDSITFSGKTLKLAIDKLKEWFPEKIIRPGVLILDELLEQEISENEKHPLAGIICEKITDRHEIFFPWGVTQATGVRYRKFEGLDNSYGISIDRRPWGSIEILADEKFCSVRILTIEADKCLSFQRHLCRDEFFVSIDENIGLEICSESLNDGDQYDSFSDIPYIKSLVLEKGDYILIPKGIWHRFKASKERVRLLEIGYGIYDQDNDIERKQDRYGREGSNGRV